MAGKEFTYNVLEEIAIIAEPETGYDTRVKIISWNGGKPKFDIRKWNKTNDKMAKGISLTMDEIYNLKKVLDEFDFSNYEEISISDDIDM